MGKLNSKLSSWRSHSVSCTAQNTTTYFFMDTSPNMFYIQNTSDKSLYVGLSYMPTIDRYEFEIKPHSQRAIGRPLPVKNIYFLNPSGEDIPVQLWSIEDVFDVSIFQDLSVDNITFDSDAMDKLSFDGIIRGINCALPAGSNTIGTVNIGAFQSGANSIMSNINTKVTEMTSKLSTMSNNLNLFKDKFYSDNDFTYVYKSYSGATNIFPNNTAVRFVEVYDFASGTATVTNENGETLSNVTLKSGQKFKAKQINVTPTSGNIVCLRYMEV